MLLELSFFGSFPLWVKQEDILICICSLCKTHFVPSLPYSSSWNSVWRKPSARLYLEDCERIVYALVNKFYLLVPDCQHLCNCQGSTVNQTDSRHFSNTHSKSCTILYHYFRAFKIFNSRRKLSGATGYGEIKTETHRSTNNILCYSIVISMSKGRRGINRQNRSQEAQS